MKTKFKINMREILFWILVFTLIAIGVYTLIYR